MFLAVLLPMACAVAVGWPALDGTFCRDDWVYVPLNPIVTGDSSLVTIFGSPFHPEHAIGLYRPVTNLSFAWNWGQAGEAPRAWHATNLALSAVSAGLLACLLLLWRVPALFSALGAAAFAVHPARSEAVLWISARSELLMTAFALLALVLAQGIRGAWKWLPCALAAVLSAFSKEQGFVLVLLAPLLPFLAKRDRVIGFVALLAALGAAFAWRRHVLGATGPEGPMQVLPGATAGDLVLQGLYHLGRYAGLVFRPARLLIEYDDPVRPLCWVWILVGIVTALLPPALFLMRRPRAAFAALLFVVPLVPVLNVLYRTGEIFAERFLCLPLAGMAALAALAFASFERWRVIAAAVFLALVMILAARFFSRAGDWTSQRALVEAQLRDAPDLGASHHMVAADLLDEFSLQQPDPKDAALAGQYLVRALELAPQRAGAAMTLGRTHLRAAARAAESDPARARDLAEAERLFRAAVRAAPGLPQARGALGLTLAYQGKNAEAEAMMREEIRLHPQEFRAAINLAQLLETSKRADEAKAVRENALRAALDEAALHPGRSGPLRVAAQIALDLGQQDRAIVLAKDALKIQDVPEARASAAVAAAAILAAAGLPSDAQRVLEETRSELGAAPPSASREIALATLDQSLGEKERAQSRLAAALPSARGLAERRIRALLKTSPASQNDR